MSWGGTYSCAPAELTAASRTMCNHKICNKIVAKYMSAQEKARDATFLWSKNYNKEICETRLLAIIFYLQLSRLKLQVTVSLSVCMCITPRLWQKPLQSGSEASMNKILLIISSMTQLWKERDMLFCNWNKSIWEFLLNYVYSNIHFVHEMCH